MTTHQSSPTKPTGPPASAVPSVPEARRSFWRALVFTHRWLGIAGCLLFAAWFASGIVMIYVRMPELGANERRDARAPVDFSKARVSPADLVRLLGVEPTQVRLAMLYGHPVYRAIAGGRWVTVFADVGQALRPLTQKEALNVVAPFVHGAAGGLRYDARLTEPDQWTLQSRAFLPMHRIAAGDADGTVLYVSDHTGDVEMKTTARSRRWAYAGPVIHWLYFTPLRRHSEGWAQTIIWLSIAGFVMCVSGLAWGWSVARRSPYAGIMRWHHYAGLIFGAFTCTWIFSGLLSMDPWDWHPSTAPTREQRDAVAGGPLRVAGLPLQTLQRGVEAIASADTKEIEIVQFERQLFLKAGGRLLSALAPDRGVMTQFDNTLMLAAARQAMPGVPVADYARLFAYDSYYYDRDGELPLPVVRVRFLDPPRTWLYLDPARGAIVRKEQRLSRVNRWLYHGLHSLDFPFLYWRRPLWDIVMIVLSLGGLASAVTSLLPAWRRVRRVARRAG
ncbi:MAG TPA: hypothetical protein VNG89_10860 [Vicinamibacterales bacterium]|nr:hypothetical protein [Vicinamibacterales bacterium]